MKLPTGEGMNNFRQQPLDTSDEGGAAFSGSRDEDLVHDSQASPPDLPNAEVDFSEFLWMEHQEEYDREVLRELDEDMAHYYFELSEAALQAEADGREFPYAPVLRAIEELIGSGEDFLSSVNCSPTTLGSGQNPEAPEFIPEGLISSFNRNLTLGLGSGLNSEAPEFIPRGSD